MLRSRQAHSIPEHLAKWGELNPAARY